MNTERKPYCVNQIMKGEIIFERGSEAAYVGLVLKGRVRIQAEGVNLVIGSGHFLGLTDLQDGMYRVTYQLKRISQSISFVPANFRRPFSRFLRRTRIMQHLWLLH